MKNIIVILITVAMSLGVPLSYAQDNNTFTLNVEAYLPPVLDLGYWVRWADAVVRPRVEPYDERESLCGDADDINFNEIYFDHNYKIYMAKKYFTVFLCAITSRRPYTLSQSCDGIFLDGSPEKNLNKNIIATPDYKEEDRYLDTNKNGEIDDGDVMQGERETGEVVNNTEGFFAASNSLIYSSDTGRSRAVRCYYGIFTDDDTLEIPAPAEAEVIDGDYATGSYSGEITFTLLEK